MKIAVLGAGAWGAALAISFAARHEVALWARKPEDRARLERERRSRYLPEVVFPEAIGVVPELATALRDADLVLVATATRGLRETLQGIASIDPEPRLAWACKGFEQDSRMLPHEVVADALPGATRVGVLSGPSFALEVALGKPTALVFASGDAEFAADTAAALNSERLRIYSSADVIGVELGGSVKNVIAIAAGIADGLALGRNARAALVTRGLAEVVRLGVALGGAPQTFMGLTGVGDLVLTCTGDLSRNREVGVRLAHGRPLESILRELGHVAEGVPSAPSVLALARENGIEMPITEAVCAVLFEGRSPSEAVRQLLSRDPKPE
ncbi:glycerol-3-phosphate dehydrogenase [Betaproteobacteria bacterium GR16-43]|nr:glycerol-3-phosphate dehydrogenase [Betaproteobacteria bacterium GR16-43]